MALYNKYKPRKITDILGQNLDIFEALCKNPDKGNAIIFTGPPGTGKTLLAHIYSKYVNCTSNTDKPCMNCDSCTSCDNVFETDGAIQTGVESIRELITAIQYPPIKGKYQIFLIDEVHMLSPAAKDSMLLMLHNPPAHARVIFATTAIEKLPDTFVSRCIVYRVRRLSDLDILNILQNICKGEGKIIDNKILDLITQHSDGSAGKAISYLEVMLLCENITFEMAKNYMNVLDDEVCIKIIESCLSQNVSSAIQMYENLKNGGYNEKTILHHLLKVINNLFLFKYDCDKENNERYLNIIKNFNITNDWLVNVFDILCKALVYSYQIGGPNIKMPSILIMISTVLPGNTLSSAVKKAFESNITDSFFAKSDL